MSIPAHWWQFNEQDGNAANDTIGSITGTLTNTTRLTPGYPSSHAVHITGSNDSYVSFAPSVGQFATSDFTISFWLNTTETLPYFDLFGNRTSNGHGNFFSIRMTGVGYENLPEGTLVFEVDEDARGTNYICATTSMNPHAVGLNDGRWHNVTVIRENSNLWIYVDGAYASSDRPITGTANLNNNNELRIGRSVENDAVRFSPNALFADLRIWTSAQSHANGLSKADLDAAIRKYGPILRYHPEEAYLPSSVEWFIERSWLCTKDSKIQATLDNLPTDAPNGSRDAYWLELKDKQYRSGDLSGAISYVHAKPSLTPGFTDITFWFFFPFRGPGTMSMVPFRSNVSLGKYGQHTGDWESVTLRINTSTKALDSVYMAHHDSGQWITDLSQIDTKDGHPIVYVAENGHGSYPGDGSNPWKRESLAMSYPLAGKIYDFFLFDYCRETGLSRDYSVNYVLVSADYLGDEKPTEPAWLNYFYRWGPTIEYAPGSLDAFLRSIQVFPWLMAPLTTYLLANFPDEVKREKGPAGPKEKGSWLGRPED